MATDCYALFKTTFAQAKADGFTDAVATSAAQSAMDNCLRNSSVQQTPAQPITPVPGSRLEDMGPVIGGQLNPSARGSQFKR